MRRLVLFLLPFLLFSCGTEDVPKTAETSPPERIRIGIRKEPKSLNPYLVNSPAGDAVVGRLFPRLFREELSFENNMPVLTPRLVKAHQWDETGLVLTMELKPGLMWSDGAPLTTKDVGYSLDIQKDKTIAWYLSDVDTAPTGWEIVDDQKMTITFAAKSLFNILNLNEGRIIPAHHFGNIPTDQWRDRDWSKDLVVFGPYKPSTYDPGQRLVLEPLKPGTAPVLGFAFIADKERLYQLLLNKEMDMAWPLPVERVPDIRAHLTSHIFQDLSYTFIGWNPIQPKAFKDNDGASPAELHRTHPHPLFSDVRIRKALTLAMNRKDYNQRVWDGEVSIPATPWRSGLPYFNDRREARTFDREAAGKLLDEAGWTLVNGKRVKNGKPFAFTVICNAGSEYRKLYLLAIQEDMRVMGIDMQIDLQEPGLYFQNMQTRNYDAIFGKLTTGTHPTLNYTFHSSSPFNLTSWTGIDKELEALSSAEVPEEMRDLIAKSEDAFQAQLPMTLLYTGKEVLAASDPNLDVLSNYTDPLYEVSKWRRR
ncbi:MAG: ABC transporter substrate-binding protein [Acidobacteriota bacterium]|nr:ABC transporter substrate-binding protein [Acidobacteriota bacterium]